MMMRSRVENESVAHFNQMQGVLHEPSELKRGHGKYRTLAKTLYAQLRARTRELAQQSDELRDLYSRLLQAQDEERRRLARELHDSAGQTLTLLSMSIALAAQHAPKKAKRYAKYTKECEQLVQQLSREICTLSYLLHPPLLDEMGLLKAICSYTEGVAERSGLKIAVEAPADFQRLSPEIELMMFRLVQECLTNIHRHSGSRTAVIRIAQDGEHTSLEVQDAGKGISAERLLQIQSQGCGVGVRGMRERVGHFGGQMDIESNRGGTKVSFRFPFARIATSRPEIVIPPQSIVSQVECAA